MVRAWSRLASTGPVARWPPARTPSVQTCLIRHVRRKVEKRPFGLSGRVSLVLVTKGENCSDSVAIAMESLFHS